MGHVYTLGGMVAATALLTISCNKDNQAFVAPPAAVGPTDANAATAPAAGEPAQPAAPEPFALADGEQLVNYRVQKGDSLWKLAQQFDTRVSRIQSANSMTGETIIEGQNIKIPTKSGAPAASPAAPAPQPVAATPEPAATTPAPAPAPAAPAPAPQSATPAPQSTSSLTIGPAPTLQLSTPQPQTAPATAQPQTQSAPGASATFSTPATAQTEEPADTAAPAVSTGGVSTGLRIAD